MKSSFIAISGPTNSGKSTLLNCFAKKKVSIVSKKIQTTNFNIEFSINYKNTQMIFIDTPGFYKDNINDNYLREALQGLERADIVIFILDINNKFRHLDKIENNMKYEIAISNPPYIPTNEIKTLTKEVRKHDPFIALNGGKDGLDSYRSILSNLKNIIKSTKNE